MTEPSVDNAAYPVVEWLTSVEHLRYADYWNNEDEERRKPFWIVDGHFDRMEQYLAGIGLPDQLETCAAIARSRFARGIRGIGCDLGAGSLWAVPHLLRLGAINRVYCVEYSRHRLFKLGPAVLQHYRVTPDRVVLALGDLHHLSVPAATFDFVLLSTAFHHSDRPEALLAEIRRVLKPEGVVLVIGEHVTDARPRDRVRHMLKFVVARALPAALQRKIFHRLLSVTRFLPSDDDPLIGDDRLGDHAYTRTQYMSLFNTAGFTAECVRRPDWAYQAFVLVPGDWAS